MRNLLLLIGNQCQGKSTWIEQNHLRDFTLSYDTIRSQMGHPLATLDGRVSTNEKVNPEMINIFKKMFESRLNIGSFTVIDNMNVREAELNYFRNIASIYGYRLFYKDFRNNRSLEECLASNETRIHKYIPPSAIEETYELQKLLRFNKSWTEIQDIKDIWATKDVKFWDYTNKYKKIYYVGDLHGCVEELRQFLDLYYSEDNYYVFTGDYVDRGPDSVGVMIELSRIYANGNVTILEGNHERWTRLWSNSNEDRIRSKEFNENTIPQFLKQDEETGAHAFTKSDARSFVRKLDIYSAFEFYGKKLFASHGGVSRIDGCNPGYSHFCANEYISGTGNYNDLLKLYLNKPDNVDYIIHGHRNKADQTFSGKYINLEGSIEQGGHLKFVVFDESGLPTSGNIKSNFNYMNNGKSAIEDFRASDHIKETKLTDYMSSFNFTKELFYAKAWSKVTVKARGMFVDILQNKILARSYNKFFYLDEVPESSEYQIRNKAFPFKAYEKSNGYLGIVSHNPYTERLLIASKSTTEGDYADKFRELLNKHTNTLAINRICKKHNVSLVFEVIDPVFDPHIIRYKEEGLVLLDVIPNEFVFSMWSDEKRLSVLKEISLPGGNLTQKKLVATFYTFDEMMKFFIHWKDSNIEGLVLQDSNGFLFKYKTSRYSYIKLMRGYWDTCRKSQGTQPITGTISVLNERGLLYDGREPRDFAIVTKAEAIKLANYVKENYDKFTNIIDLYDSFNELQLIEN